MTITRELIRTTNTRLRFDMLISTNTWSCKSYIGVQKLAQLRIAKEKRYFKTSGAQRPLNRTSAAWQYQKYAKVFDICGTYGSVGFLLTNMHAILANVNAAYDAVEVVHDGNLSKFGEPVRLVVPVRVKSAKRVLSEIEIYSVLVRQNIQADFLVSLLQAHDFEVFYVYSRQSSIKEIVFMNFLNSYCI